MDSYFKSAVCDLDKLLDEFEQNPGLLEYFLQDEIFFSSLFYILDILIALYFILALINMKIEVTVFLLTIQLLD